MRRNSQFACLSMLVLAGAAMHIEAQNPQPVAAHANTYQSRGLTPSAAKASTSYDFNVWAYEGSLKWKDIDSSGETNYITADGTGNLYQLTDRNWVGIWSPSVGSWQALDSFGEGIISIFPNGEGTGLFEIRKDYSVWEWTGQWTDSEGGVFQEVSLPVSEEPYAQPYPVQIAASGNWITKLMSDGTVWILEPGTAPSQEVWIEIDTNHAQSIAQDGAETYETRVDGGIWGTNDSAVSWQVLDVSPHNASLAASGGHLYQLHGNSSDRSIWMYSGSGTSWVELDNLNTSIQIVAAGSHLFELRSNGTDVDYVGPACSGGSCKGWQVLDANPMTGQIASGNAGQLYEFHGPVIEQ